MRPLGATLLIVNQAPIRLQNGLVCLAIVCDVVVERFYTSVSAEIM